MDVAPACCRHMHAGGRRGRALVSPRRLARAVARLCPGATRVAQAQRPVVPRRPVGRDARPLRRPPDRSGRGRRPATRGGADQPAAVVGADRDRHAARAGLAPAAARTQARGNARHQFPRRGGAVPAPAGRWRYTLLCGVAPVGDGGRSDGPAVRLGVWLPVLPAGCTGASHGPACRSSRRGG